MGLLNSRSAAVGHLTVHCRLFAQYAELLGVSSTRLELGAPATVLDAIARLREQIPNGHLLPERPLVAVNQEHALATDVLADGDEVAVLPPLAGG